MTYVYRAYRWIAAGRHARVAAGTLLGLPALAEALTWHTGTPANPQYLLLLCLVCLGTTLPLALPYPTVAATTIAGAGVLSLAAFGTLTVAGLVAELIAGYRLGRRGSRSVAVLLGLPYLALALALPAEARVRVLSVLVAALVPAAGLAGTVRRADIEARANRTAQREIAGTLLDHAARGERARIARELHDVVAHHLSMIAVQAETARLTTPGLPPTGAQRLSAIGDTARAALTEMRRLLGVLREDAQTDVADRRPQPSLRQLNELLDAARDASGTGTRLILHGPPVALDPGVELAAYRIVQESLTNSRRHAPGAAVDVVLHYTDDALHLSIRDNGPGPPATPAANGHGLLGMRERTAAVGGRFRTGPAAGGGFLVEATLPARTERDP
jgi:signal transduction histidine kinase